MRLVGATASSKVPVWNFARPDLTFWPSLTSFADLPTERKHRYTWHSRALFILRNFSGTKRNVFVTERECYHLVKATSCIRMSLKKRCLGFANVAEPNPIRGPLCHAQMLSQLLNS
jgi:hypothetical protein